MKPTGWKEYCPSWKFSRQKGVVWKVDLWKHWKFNLNLHCIHTKPVLFQSILWDCFYRLYSTNEIIQVVGTLLKSCALGMAELDLVWKRNKIAELLWSRDITHFRITDLFLTILKQIMIEFPVNLCSFIKQLEENGDVLCTALFLSVTWSMMSTMKAYCLWTCVWKSQWPLGNGENIAWKKIQSICM